MGSVIVPKLIVAPVAPITLTEAKWHLRVDHDTDDALIESYIASAWLQLDGPDAKAGKAIAPQTWEIALDEFPEAEVALPVGPVVSITSVKYDDGDGVEQTADADTYQADTYGDPGWAVPTGSWPSTLDAVNAVRIRWVAGRGADERWKQAAMLLIGHYYAHREAAGDAAEELPLGVDALVGARRRIVLV